MISLKLLQNNDLKAKKSHSKDSEAFELPSSSSVLEPDYADIATRLRLKSQPRFLLELMLNLAIKIGSNRL